MADPRPRTARGSRAARATSTTGTRATAPANAAAAAEPVLRLPTGAVAVPSLDWFTALPAGTQLAAGAAAPTPLRVPVASVNRLIRSTIRFVADLPAGASGTLVWAQGASELVVQTDGVQLACAPGMITVTVPVSCDQVPKPVAIPVPFAVGTVERPAGLVMATYDRLAGPELITAIWSEAIAAFAWEALVHLSQQLSAATGKDADGRPLVPALLAADADLLVIQPMARHDLSAGASK